MSKKTKAEKRWFCEKHGLEGIVGKSWCFGCYKIDEDTDMPVPYIGYKNNCLCGRPWGIRNIGINIRLDSPVDKGVMFYCNSCKREI